MCYDSNIQRAERGSVTVLAGQAFCSTTLNTVLCIALELAVVPLPLTIL